MATPTLHPLRHPPFVWFWLGQSVSLLGDRVYSVALPFLVLELGGGAGELGRVLAVYFVPQLLFLVLGGVFVDKLPRRLTLIASDLAHALLLIVVLALAGNLALTHLYVLSGVFGLLSAFFMPAAMSITPQLVPRDVLTQANATRVRRRACRYRRAAARGPAHRCGRFGPSARLRRPNVRRRCALPSCDAAPSRSAST